MKGIFITKFWINVLNKFSYELNLIDREPKCNTFIHNNNNNHMIIQILVVINKRNTNNKQKKKYMAIGYYIQKYIITQ